MWHAVIAELFHLLLKPFLPALGLQVFIDIARQFTHLLRVACIIIYFTFKVSGNLYDDNNLMLLS